MTRTNEDDARIYPCADCGVMRSKAEGGTTFTVCDECWDAHYARVNLLVSVEGEQQRIDENKDGAALLPAPASAAAPTEPLPNGVEVCLGCGKPVEDDCGCPAGTGWVRK